MHYVLVTDGGVRNKVEGYYSFRIFSDDGEIPNTPSEEPNLENYKLYEEIPILLGMTWLGNFAKYNDVSKITIVTDKKSLVTTFMRKDKEWLKPILPILEVVTTECVWVPRKIIKTILGH